MVGRWHLGFRSIIIIIFFFAFIRAKMCTAPRPDHAHTGPRRGGDQGSRALRRPRLQLHSKMIKAAEKEDACFPELAQFSANTSWLSTRWIYYWLVLPIRSDSQHQGLLVHGVKMIHVRPCSLSVATYHWISSFMLQAVGIADSHKRRSGNTWRCLMMSSVVTQKMSNPPTFL